jgi:hypothetical protein
MEISMAKAIRKTSKSSTNVPQGAPPASPEKIVTSAPRVPRAQEDAYGMVDAGELWVDRQFRQRQETNRAKKAAEQAARIRHVEGMRAQMQKAGVDMSKPAPGISRLNPEVFAKPLAKAGGVQAVTTMASKDPLGIGKQSKTTRILMTKAKGPSKFKQLVRRIIQGTTDILTGSHMNVSMQGQPQYGGTLRPKITRQGPSPK